MWAGNTTKNRHCESRQIGTKQSDFRMMVGVLEQIPGHARNNGLYLRVKVLPIVAVNNFNSLSGSDSNRNANLARLDL